MPSYYHSFGIPTDLDSDSDETPPDDHLAEAQLNGDYAPYPNKLVRQILSPQNTNTNDWI